MAEWSKAPDSSSGLRERAWRHCCGNTKDSVDCITASNNFERGAWNRDDNGQKSYEAIVRSQRISIASAFRKLSQSEGEESDSHTRWVKSIPIKINIFAWKVSLDRLPTRSNLVRRGVLVSSDSCSIGYAAQEDLAHLLFRCDMASSVSCLVCRWWNIVWIPLDSYQAWLSWFKSIRMPSRSKGVLEGVFYITWWSIWNFRNQLFFASKKPRKEVLFDDRVMRSFNWYSARRNSSICWDS
ncbi:RNA-directed DNA polymerase, eukaryota, Reverse transcriptase zinc-binding domain protein [Artemisia annua]|uniref:RNA-directed DNA polymerase, eukaryota, Reverse transcriptase zinc-binding domain protein n=1 Tax=Artemisia annua TaxID=35608 RepID=A0A2U1N5I5_ARTAN|nr:RNA-directed DNA polymerase, eukaryota, Reverse transcriptase zinc-binding domain protein [Artemisia annua]